MLFALYIPLYASHNMRPVSWVLHHISCVGCPTLCVLRCASYIVHPALRALSLTSCILRYVLLLCVQRHLLWIMPYKCHVSCVICPALCILRYMSYVCAYCIVRTVLCILRCACCIIVPSYMSNIMQPVLCALRCASMLYILRRVSCVL